jgi:hypothetical protein
MQATNGLAGLFRRRGRVIGCCMALALALSALVFAPGASAAEKPPVTTYLALGTSLAFGYQQEKFEKNFPNEAPSYFESGYPNYFAKKLKALKTENNKGLVIVNNGCPGETTDSFIGNGALGKVVNKKTGENPFGESPACPYHFEQGLPLHHNLATLSQLESGLSVLNPCFTKKSVCAPAHPVKAVTLDLGANDELRAVKICIAKVKDEFEKTIKEEQAPPPNFPDAKLEIRECAVKDAVDPKGTFAHIIKNVETIVGLIRSPEFGNYKGPVIMLGFYNAFSFVLEGSDGLQKILNDKFEASVNEGALGALGVQYANPFKLFNPAPEEGKKEAIKLGCAGAPYTPETPAQDGFVCTTLIEGKYANMGNPNDIAANKAKKEAENKKEEEAGKIVIFPYGGEGDIHPTDVGYVQLGKALFALYP